MTTTFKYGGSLALHTSQRMPLSFGCTVETVVTSFILPVYLVTIAVFSYELCSVSF